MCVQVLLMVYGVIWISCWSTGDKSLHRDCRRRVQLLTALIVIDQKGQSVGVHAVEQVQSRLGRQGELVLAHAMVIHVL